MQVPPQFTKPDAQDNEHVPPLQTWPALHTVPSFAPWQLPTAPQ
jgi:hypothetical protein